MTDLARLFVLPAFFLMGIASANDRPNILIIYADDMGYGDLAAQNGDSKIATPHLDKLAAEGLRLTDAHSSSGICTPSRYALLTGRYHWRKFHGIVNAWGDSVFAPERTTLPEMLQTRGYKTACIGKWHLGFDWDSIRRPDAEPETVGKKKVWAAEDFDWSKAIPNGPLAHGFDYYFGDDVPNFPPYAWIENDRVLEAPSMPYVPDPLPAEGSPEGRPGPMVKGWKQDAVMPTLTQRVVDWLAGQKDTEQPFFLYWPWTSPHAPIVPVESWKGRSQAGGFGDFVAQSDWHAGQVLQALEENGLADNTLVIFTADNGPETYAYERIRNFQHRSSGPLRGVKRDIWEGGHRVPMIIRWPGKTKPGTVTDGLMSQIDIMATIAAIVGVELQPGTAEDSFDQRELWMGGNSQRRSLIHNTRANHFAVREGDWLLIDGKSGGVSRVPEWFNQANDYATNSFETALYNLSEDLPQRRNLTEEQPEKVSQLRVLLEHKRSHGEVR